MRPDDVNDAGRRPSVLTLEPGGALTIATVAVIGAGHQGRSFALRCAEAGFRTVLEDVMPARLRKAREELDVVEMHAGSALSGVQPGVSSRLSFALTVEDAVREADLAIDFVPDELESKLEIFSLIDRMAPPRTILCTPTQSLSISDLASCTYRADRCLALRSARGNSLGGELILVPGNRVTQQLAKSVEAWLRGMSFAVRYGEDPEQA